MLNQPHCFVIQPFDGDKYDQRFEQVYRSAIENAGFFPYRVDRDKAVIIPIDTIEQMIRESALCFAEITENNPNVWHEVGYARALGKKIIYVSEKKEKYPFDIQHYRIITYETNSLSSYIKLKQEITDSIKAKMKDIDSSPEQKESFREHIDGLDFIEILVLKFIMEDNNYACTAYGIKHKLEEFSIEEIASWFAINELLNKNLIESFEVDYYGDNVNSYRLTNKAKDWALANKSIFAKSNIQHYKSIFYKQSQPVQLADEIPF